MKSNDTQTEKDRAELSRLRELEARHLKVSMNKDRAVTVCRAKRGK